MSSESVSFIHKNVCVSQSVSMCGSQSVRVYVWASEVIDILKKRLNLYGGGCGLWHGRINVITLD